MTTVPKQSTPQPAQVPDLGPLPDDVRVRALASTDETVWRGLFAEHCQFHGVVVPPDIVSETFKRLCEQTHGLEGDVAVDAASGECLGLMHTVVHASTWSITGYCYLEDLYVNPTARSRGVGRALLATLYKRAEVRGYDRLYWMAMRDNTNARALYNRIAKETTFVIYEQPGLGW